MAIAPPPLKPVAAPTLTKDQQAVVDAKLLDQLDKGVERWIAAQRLTAPISLNISIGERGKISAGVLAALCGRYVAAGWSQASTTQELPDTLVELVDGKPAVVDGKPLKLDVGLVTWNGKTWTYTAPPAPGAETGIAYPITPDKFAFTTKPDPRGIVLHLVP